jgi:hypothetical protein
MTRPQSKVNGLSPDERAFLTALSRWMVERWRPSDRFHGEFDVAVLMSEAVPWANPDLSRALDQVLPGVKRMRTGCNKGSHRPAPIVKLLGGLANRGLLKRTGTSWDGWYDIIEDGA